MVQLAKDHLTRPDIAPIDTGSTNLEAFDPATGVFGHADVFTAMTLMRCSDTRVG